MCPSSRDIFEQTIRGKTSYRPPLDFGGMTCSIIDGTPYGYRALCDYLDVKDVSVTRRHGSNVVYPIAERIYEKLHIDFRHVRMGEPKKTISSELVLDAWGVKRRKIRDNWYPVDPPMKEAKSEKVIEEYDGWPNPEDPVYIEGIRQKAKYYHENTDYVLCVDPGEARSIVERYSRMRGFTQKFIDMKVNPEFYHALMSKILQASVDLIAVLLNEVGDFVDIVCIADDLGSQTHPFMSPSDFRKNEKPYIEGYIRAIKRLAPKSRILFHSDGAIFPLIGELIDAGVEILNPIQPGARDMDPHKLAAEYGGKVCFHGGIDVQQKLPLGSAEEVRSHVLSTINALIKGGYILAPSQAISGDVPPENIYTMYETGYRYNLR